jgi:hypothetical protein
MAESKAKTLPKMNSMSELVDFFDTHDMGDYWEQMPEVDFEVGIKGRKHLVALEEEVATQVTQIAKEKKIPSEALINTWLKEKLRKVG